MKCDIKQFEELSNQELYEIMRARIEVFIIEQECFFQDLDEHDQNAYHFLIKDKEHVMAYLRVLPKGEIYPEVSIGRVLVTEQYRKRGMARLIMNVAMEFISKELQETKIQISAQTYLIKFYESLGFKITSEMYLEDGLEHIDMEFISK